MGLHYDERGMGVCPERAPFPFTTAGRKAARISSRLGHPRVYERALTRSGVELVHAHFGTGAVEILAVAQRQRLPLVVTFHGHDVNRAPHEDPLYADRLERVFAYASHLLPVSDHIADKLLALGAPVDRTTVHHLGIPLQSGDVGPEKAAALRRSGVLHVGRLVAYKGADDLVRSYAALPDAVRVAHPLTIVGDGPERQRLEQLAETLVGPGVRFLGTRPSCEVAELMARARVFVAPSKQLPNGDSEAFGLTMIEAAREGGPVVAYDCAGAREAVDHGETGILVGEGRVDALGRAVEQLLGDDTLARQMGESGRRRVHDQFDLARQTLTLESIYDEAVARQPRVPRVGADS